MKQNIRDGGKPVTSSLDICPEACGRKWWGQAKLRLLPPSLYAAQASRVAKLELAPALLLFKKVFFLLY
jgi:hypothetical protein